MNAEPNLKTEPYSISMDRVTNIGEFKRSEKLTCQLICSDILVDPVKCIYYFYDE